MAKPIVTPEERFMSRVEPEPNTGCWLWTGPSNSKGYGKTTHGFMPSGAGRIVLAHRMAWIIRFGSIPDGLCVLHRCDNPPCVNTDHLFLGTQGDNSTDKARKCRGVTSRKGLPFGVKTCVNGTLFGSQVRYRGVKHYLGSYPTAAEASAAAVAFKEQLLSAKEIE